ncbi:hypothetical protein PG993_013679 [Apiospora rasikravindrae]|uniref:Uncharacterized protein n=1 Tax=Apiospora rasikravindrae TaxID=990691 RepID=A0ABR1RQV1_9PEZI
MIRHPKAWTRLCQENEDAGFMDGPIAYADVLATIVREYDIQQVALKQRWLYHAYLTVVPQD